jgi:phenylpropionate dioxygenase-like ring-hydroxylating dioxygenase large terminal subunit
VACQESIDGVGEATSGLGHEPRIGVRLRARHVLGTRVVLYGDPARTVRVQSAYCPHLGADLSVGELVDGQIRRAYRHWRFDGAGRCVDIPTGVKIPPGAKIWTYPSAEAWGLIGGPGDRGRRSPRRGEGRPDDALQALQVEGTADRRCLGA